MKRLLLTAFLGVQLTAYCHTRPTPGLGFSELRQPTSRADWLAIAAAIRPGMQPEQVAAVLRRYHPVIMPGSIQGGYAINYFLTPRWLLVVWYDRTRGAMGSGTLMDNPFPISDEEFLTLQRLQLPK